ncbi:MAG: VWA domain-containing protein [Anaerolineae bacterium]|nr:VWA domain-containing protein [Anaerolineae bacterium]
MRADFALDYDVLTVERPQQLYLMARFEAGTGPREAVRRPLNVSLVIDRSGSMAGEKIDYTRQAAQFLVQHLSRRDIFSVVLYNDKVETLLEPEPVLNKDRVMQSLDKMRVRGTTNLSGGWLQGCQHVAENQGGGKLNRVILMTDGLANRGVTDPNQLVQMSRQKQLEGISTTTMGMGTDFNEDLLIEMAHAGGGAYYFIESPEVAPQIFQEELSG